MAEADAVPIKNIRTIDDLPCDILNLISKKLTFDPDYVRFRSVCKSWRIAAPKRPPLPWIFGVDDFKFRHILFFKPSFENREIDQLLRVKVRCGNKCVGSSRGWLALMNPSTLEMSLTNPITLSTIPLPPIPFCAEDGCIREPNIMWIPCEDSDDVILPHPFYRNFTLSSDPGDYESPCLAVIICYYHHTLSYCTIGDVCWSRLEIGETLGKGISGGMHIHCCFYKEKLYLAHGSDLYVCKLGSDPSVAIATDHDSLDVVLFDELHLVESNGDLLLLIIPQRFQQEYELEVYLVVETEDEMVDLVAVKSLGNRVLFMSRTTCLSLPACKIPGCKENSIYYPWGYKVQVFNLDGESHELVENELLEASPSEIYWRMYSWFTPSLLS